MIKIDRKYNCFFKNGEVFFYLADTVWSAFTNIKAEEWEIYLKHRKSQGFNVLQINILPQGDRSENTWDNPMPFRIDANGDDIYSEINDEYFQHCADMLEVARKYGFTPALVLLWGDRVYGTWSNVNFKSKAMPLECVAPYIEKCVDYFARFNPIWYISGDSDFPEAAMPWYNTAHRIVRERTPDLLCSYHTGAELLDEELVKNNKPDFYTYQSGHARSQQFLTYEVAQKYTEIEVIKPTINSEPWYEGIASIENNRLYKCTRDDVRCAMWWSLLGGAKAGYTYGAHGIWNWHREGQFYCVSELFGNPLDWTFALNLPGAWDVGFAKEIFLQNEMYKMNPNKEIIKNCHESVRCMSNEDMSKFVVYMPYTNEIEFLVNLSDYNLKAINLKERRYEVLNVKGNKVMPGTDIADYLLLFSK